MTLVGDEDENVNVETGGDNLLQVAQETGESCDNWSEVEVSKLYEYLCDHMAHNPVLVATVSEYERDIDRIDWCDRAFRLPRKSAVDRRNKWLELAKKFQEASQRLNSPLIRDIQQEVLPRKYKLLRRASSRKVFEISTEQLAKCIEIIFEQPFIASLRDVDVRTFSEKLRRKKILAETNADNIDGGDVENRIIKRIRWMEFLCINHKCFQKIPVEHETFFVRLQFLVYILQRIKTFRVKRKVMDKHLRRFIRSHGWTQRKLVILVDKSMKSNKQDSVE